MLYITLYVLHKNCVEPVVRQFHSYQNYRDNIYIYIYIFIRHIGSKNTDVTKHRRKKTQHKQL